MVWFRGLKVNEEVLSIMSTQYILGIVFVVRIGSGKVGLELGLVGIGLGIG